MHTLLAPMQISSSAVVSRDAAGPLRWRHLSLFSSQRPCQTAIKCIQNCTHTQTPLFQQLSRVWAEDFNPDVCRGLVAKQNGGYWLLKPAVIPLLKALFKDFSLVLFTFRGMKRGSSEIVCWPFSLQCLSSRARCSTWGGTAAGRSGVFCCQGHVHNSFVLHCAERLCFCPLRLLFMFSSNIYETLTHPLLFILTTFCWHCRHLE